MPALFQQTGGPPPAPIRGLTRLFRGPAVLDRDGPPLRLPANVAITEDEVRVRFHRRTHLPIVLASGLFNTPVAVPWWNGRPLRLVE